jgi:tetratricopeptide (TPR) repeat protein
MILYRPVSLQELALIYDSGMKAFPALLPKQPIFYPVLQLAYARQTASKWNSQHAEFAGYVTEFKVEAEYISRFEEHTVSGTQYQELWIPADEMQEFNKHIVGHIKVLEAYFGNAFEGFIPEAFGLQGKNAVEQFTLLANSYLYKRMDFYLEIKRNHKAVFLNYPFWQKYEFKNAGLKGKIVQAIKEAWFTSFPQVPLPSSPPESAAPVSQTPEPSLVDPDREDDAFDEETDPDPFDDPVDEQSTPAEKNESPSIVRPVQAEIKPATKPYSDSLMQPVRNDIPAVRDTPLPNLVTAPPEEPVALPAQPNAHFVRGIELGLSGRYHEAVAELSRAVEEDGGHIVAHTSLGVAYHRLGEDDRALESYESALRIDPIHAEAHYFRANILYGQEDVREAIAGYMVAIGLKPELIEVHKDPAPEDRLTDYTGVPAEMVWIARPAHRILGLNRSLETEPGQTHILKERAADYERLRNYVQAIADYSSYLKAQPNDAKVLHLRGLAYEQLGQSERALEDYQRAIAINPQLSDEYIHRGITFGKMGNFRQSIDSFTESIRLAPQNPDGYFNRGTAYLQQGEFEKAIDDFSNVIRLSPGDEAAYYRRGISHEEAGHRREAVADYRQFLALSQDPNARQEIEHKLSQWQAGKQESMKDRGAVPNSRQKTEQLPPQRPDLAHDLYVLMGALGERALNSVWFGSGVNCEGEKANELYAYTDNNQPIEGRDLLSIASGIRQTIQGDFHAFDPGASSNWLFLRAWEGKGFYIEIDDPAGRERLKSHFRSLEELDGASPPYEGLFIPTGS